jgi:hypothetical protein
MSFGFGVSDFITVGNLALSTYLKCQNAPNEYREISNEAKSLHAIIEELQDAANDPESLLNRKGASQRADLLIVIENCGVTLTQLDDLISKYQKLSRHQRLAQRIWARLWFGNKQLGDIRSKLTVHTNSINVFLNSLEVRALGSIERRLDEMAAEARAGRRERSVVLSVCSENASEDDWELLKKDLVGEGISDQDVERYKDKIKVLLKFLVDNGKFEEETPERVLHEVPEIVFEEAPEGVSMSSIPPGGSA